MPNERMTLGQAIDQILSALTGLDEAGRKTALTAVSMQLGVRLGIEDGGPALGTQRLTAAASPVEQVTSQDNVRSKRIDIRSLKESKNPSSARQMACLVAYYLQELAPMDNRKDTVNAGDLEKYFKQAGFKLPTRLGQVLADAKLAGYFDQGAARGEYKLNAVGYNLVAHNLPADQS